MFNNNLNSNKQFRFRFPTLMLIMICSKITFNIYSGKIRKIRDHFYVKLTNKYLNYFLIKFDVVNSKKFNFKFLYKS